jgi:putative membrane-bound dehydrogenase-like protein
MKLTTAFFTLLLAVFLSIPAQAAAPLRIFLRAGPKTHGPAGNGQHDGPTWLADWKKLLAERGAQVEGRMGFPTAAELDHTDVLVMFAAEAGTIQGDDRANLEKFLKRGGGIVALHDAVCGTDSQWFKTVIGGAWEHGYSKWFEGEFSFYYLDKEHPITQEASNFTLDDEMYYDLHMMPEAHILAATYTPNRPNNQRARTQPGGKPSVYDIQPQMWTYEKDNYRAFVSLLGHHYKTFQKPNVRAVLLRGVAWAGKRDLNELVTKEELASLRYPEGGPTAPEKSAALLELHPDFNISLVAAEPLINKAIALNWDPAGRLWVAETLEYPNGRKEARPDLKNIGTWRDAGWRDHKTDRPATDRISILTDSNGDGRMDKKVVFYEGLELVTGFVFHRDGVIVVQAPDVLWLRDTDGDGKADKVVKLYTGLGTNDTHAVINNPRWGYDGWIYATHGYSGTEHVYNGDKTKDFGRVGSGVVRFRPDGSAFEQFSSKGGNTWGLDFGPDNELFYTQPTSGDLVMHVVLSENQLSRGKVGNTTSYKPMVRSAKTYPLLTYNEQAYVQIDWVGSFTAAAGCAIYSGGSWPKEWLYSYFTTEPTINIVHHEVMEAAGVSFEPHKTRQEEFVGGRDQWFRPIETRIGPDGALYVIDFYNQAVVHNDTRGTMHGPANAAVRPDRDHYFGRVWRIDHRQAKKIQVPNLARAGTTDLVKALLHVNRDVRMTAQRLLVEKAAPDTVKALQSTLSGSDTYARIHAVWVLGQLGKLDETASLRLIEDKDPAVRRNAIRAIDATSEISSSGRVATALVGKLGDSDSRTRLAAIVALGKASQPADPAVRRLVEIYPELNDSWSQSAVVGDLNASPARAILVALQSPKADSLKPLVALLAQQIGSRPDAADEAARLVAGLGQAGGSDELKQVALENVTRALKSDSVPAWSPELEKAFRALLAAANPALPGAALPLISRWDKNGTLAGDTKSLVSRMLSKLNDTSAGDAPRGEAVASLLAVRQMSPDILPSVAKILGSAASPDLQRRALESLGATADTAVGPLFAEAFPKLTPELQEVAFAQISKRRDWSMALLEALKGGKVTIEALGPSNLYRLRTHSDPGVARQAGTIIDELRGPEVKEKNALIAKFTPEVEKRGDAAKGKALFALNCAVCHKLGGEGKDVGPELTGMGAHGAAELLISVLDPNREVDPSFVAWDIETRDGETYSGLIARENRASVFLKNNSGEMEIKTTDIRRRRNTGRSLMPEGFEALGADGLRDVLAFVCGSDARYRVIDMKNAFTANSTRGIYSTVESARESLEFKKFGLVKVGDVPFEILSPARTPAGNNLVVLRGGSGFAKTLSQKVEISGLNVPAGKLHFLGGVGGWAYPYGGDRNANLPVAKVTVSYEDGKSDELVFKNGVEFADYNGDTDVPGSKAAPDLLLHGQVRWFTKALPTGGTIRKIVLESFNNQVAPTFVAITAEAAGEGSQAQAKVAAPAAPARTFSWGSGTKVLSVGGGSSHDFNKWYNAADSKTLTESGKISVNYTDRVGDIAGALKDIDVLYLSTNQRGLDAPEIRRAILEFVDAGKGLVLVHPALWYNYNQWPEYNRVLVGGGAHSHDKYGEFEVKLTPAKHPVTAGLPEKFTLSDELYHSEVDTQGTPIEVLATATSPLTGKTFANIWVVKHPKARIVCIALGHDGKSHDIPAYQTLLLNAVNWAAKKD